MKNVFKLDQTIATRLNCAAKLAVVALFTMLSMSPVSATDNKIDGIPEILVLALCQASVDKDKYPSDVDKVWSNNQYCCSGELQYCIECVAGGSCTKYPYSKRPVGFQKPTLTAPSDRAIAPVTPTRPTAKGKLQTTPGKLKSN
ncbi:hypothetical protein [Pararhizobium sp. IMCC21322]|uniref:hypothetical protein n=1 Tax=Pararhizobium sp. IMCC21322 TaxID=3067903 RepID=UPI002740BE8F|nr:hypothetical protein [Pararhizobium sp. IMCC21322]